MTTIFILELFTKHEYIYSVYTILVPSDLRRMSRSSSFEIFIFFVFLARDHIVLLITNLALVFSGKGPAIFGFQVRGKSVCVDKLYWLISVYNCYLYHRIMITQKGHWSVHRVLMAAIIPSRRIFHLFSTTAIIWRHFFVIKSKIFQYKRWRRWKALDILWSNGTGYSRNNMREEKPQRLRHKWLFGIFHIVCLKFSWTQCDDYFKLRKKLLM